MNDLGQKINYVASEAQNLSRFARSIGLNEAANYLEIAAASAEQASKPRTKGLGRIHPARQDSFPRR
jgi:hypothetical protein